MSKKTDQSIIKIKIEPKNTQAGTTLVTDKDVITMLNCNRKSFEAFFDASIKLTAKGNPAINSLLNDTEILSRFKNEMTFLVQDVQIASFECGLRPSFIGEHNTLELFSDVTRVYAFECFNAYNKFVLPAAFESPESIEYFEQFDFEDQKKIINPHIKLRSEYKVFVQDIAVIEPSEEIKKHFARSKPKAKEKSQKIALIDGNFDNTSGKFKWVNTLAYIEPSQIYAPDNIVVDDTVFIFNKPLDCETKLEGEYYTIYNEFLDMLVWADNFIDLKKDFEQHFYDMYNVYCKTPETKMTKKAIELKYKFLSLIKLIK